MYINGKNLRNIVTKLNDNQQNFVKIISSFNRNSGIILNLKLLGS